MLSSFYIPQCHVIYLFGLIVYQFMIFHREAFSREQVEQANFNSKYFLNIVGLLICAYVDSESVV